MQLMQHYPFLAQARDLSKTRTKLEEPRELATPWERRKIPSLSFLVGSRVKWDEKQHFAIEYKPLLQRRQLQLKTHLLGVRHTFF